MLSVLLFVAIDIVQNRCSTINFSANFVKCSLISICSIIWDTRVLKIRFSEDSTNQQPWSLTLDVLDPYTWKRHLVLTVPADVLTPTGARPLANTVLMTKSGMFSSKFLWSPMILYSFVDVVGGQDPTKCPDTLSINSLRPSDAYMRR